MSWVRWGSQCDQGFPYRESGCSAAPSPCPGSDVYVFEDVAGGFTCCDCLLGDESFTAISREEMRAHLAEHAARGHHVPMCLYVEEKREEA